MLQVQRIDDCISDIEQLLIARRHLYYYVSRGMTWCRKTPNSGHYFHLAFDEFNLSFDVQSWTMEMIGVASQVYSYYQPELRGETLGEDVTVH